MIPLSNHDCVSSPYLQSETSKHGLVFFRFCFHLCAEWALYFVNGDRRCGYDFSCFGSSVGLSP